MQMSGNYLLFQMSSRKYYYYLRPIGNPSETDMPDRRPQHAPSETDMPDRRPIEDRHACGDQLETNMPAESNRNFITYIY